MMRGFRHKGTERLFTRGDHRGVPARSAARIERMLDRLDASARSEDMNLPGFRFHRLRGDHGGTCAVSVTGNLRITFAFDGEDVVDVDLEDCHR
jgi:proteic killer suppression protein